MTRRWLMVITALLAAELGVFYAWNRDLVALARPVETLAADPAFPEVAAEALWRTRVSRRVLEHIAAAAAHRQDHKLQTRALARIVAEAPGDTSARLRLADALRADGRHAEAEVMYRLVLTASAHGVQR